MAAGGELFERSGNVYRAHKLIAEWITGVARGSRFVFDAGKLKELHRQIADGQIENNGEFRDHDVRIRGSNHVPPGHLEVPALMGTMFQYIQDNWQAKDMVHLAAFVLWRLLWIHPFTDGNGRSSRAAAYLVLCAKHGGHLPGRRTVLVQLMDARAKYCEALRDCDQLYAHTQNVDVAVQPMANLLSQMLVNQLKDVF